MNGFIYIIFNTENKKYYLGSTTNIETRFKMHLWKLKKGVHHSLHLQNAWNKYGESSFVFKVLYESMDVRLDEQNELNQLDYSKSYNISRSATGGNDAVKFHPNYEEIKQKISISKKGKIPTNRVEISVDGIIYPSYAHAKNSLNIPIVTIRYRCLSKNSKFETWFIMGRKKEKESLVRQGSKHGTQIICDEKEFDSYAEAARFYKLSITAIQHRVSSKNYPNFILKNV